MGENKDLCSYTASWIMNIETVEEKYLQCPYEREEGKEFCVFHAESKGEIEFESKLRRVLKDLNDVYQRMPENRRGNVFLNCQGFIFPRRFFYYFKDAEIRIPLVFRDSILKGDVSFEKTKFREQVVFYRTIFEERVTFQEADFNKRAVFYACQFGKERKIAPGFYQTKFHGGTSFRDSVFLGGAGFISTEFHKTVEFVNCEFSQGACFLSAFFGGETLFFKVGRSLEKDDNGFIINYQPKVLDPCAEVNFSRARFEDSAKLRLHTVDLSEWEFKETPKIEHASFDDVSWNGGIKKTRNHTRDEKVAIKTKGVETSFGAAKTVYRRIRLNYERTGDFATAEDFRTGEFELVVKNPKEAIAKRAFLWFLKLTSGYGDSFFRLFICFGLINAVFALIYQFVGFVGPGGSVVDWELSITEGLTLSTRNFLDFAKDYLSSFVFALRALFKFSFVPNNSNAGTSVFLYGQKLLSYPLSISGGVFVYRFFKRLGLPIIRPVH